MSIFDTLVVSRRTPGVAQVTMSRPAVFNAFDETMIGELDAAFAELEADPTVRVIVLAGEVNAKGKATGYHAEFSATGQARIEPGADITFNANGTYEAPVQVWDAMQGAWVDSGRESTFFPPSWSQARIEYEVSEAFKTKLAAPTGGWEGTSPSGIEVKFFWDPKNQRTTFYPMGEKQ